MGKVATSEQVEGRRSRERRAISYMIASYCHSEHGTRGEKLCPDCSALAEYADTHIARCPHMATKTFCGHCPTCCYAPEQLQAIKKVMRRAGLRTFARHPVLTIRHGLDGVKKR